MTDIIVNDDRNRRGWAMRSDVRIFVAATVLGTSVTVASAQGGPYDGSSYWYKVERQQECAWKARVSSYPPTFAYGPGESATMARQRRNTMRRRPRCRTNTLTVRTPTTTAERRRVSARTYQRRPFA